MSQSLEVPAVKPVYYALKVQIDVLTCNAGGTMQQLYKNATYAWRVTILNITTTAATQVTIVTEAGTGNAINGAAHEGEVLDAGAAQYAGGGSATYGGSPDIKTLIDASKLYWTASNTSDQISVRLEIPGERLY